VPILKKLTKIIAVSDGVAQSLNEIYGKTNNIAVINNCIDKKIIKEQSFEFISDSWFNSRDIPKAICVGRLIESKNIDFLIKSIIKVNEKFPFKLVIIGDGPLRRKLESYIYDNDLIDLIKLLGFQINPYKYLAKSDVFLFGSKPIGEGLPNVILEAMFCKVPVVSTEYLNGKGEVIENNVNGILIRQNDVDKFANSIVDLYQDKSQTKKIIEEAYSLVSTKFSKENYIKQYHEMFLTLTKNN
jgi:glycosyltransferase involved in cell wall biosynthesis